MSSQTVAQAAVLTAPDKLELRSVAVGALQPAEVLVRMVGVGVCHTDLGLIHAPADQRPIVLGHEGSGVVEAVGSEVTGITIGDRVVLSYNYDGTCDNCRRGLPMHCRSFLPLNFSGTRLDGTTPLSDESGPVLGHFFGQSSWASYAVTTERNCVVVGKDLPLELLGPLGCGVQTGSGAVLNTLKPQEGSSIAIFAMGSVGLSALLAAKVAGCSTIIAVDIDDARLEVARELGATHLVNSRSEDAVEAIRAATGGAGTDYSVDCIGLPDAVRAALECLQSPGVCASVGFQGIPNEMVLDQGSLLFGRSLVGVIEGDAVPQDFIPRLLALYREGRFPFDQMVTTFPFEQISDAIDQVHRGEVTKAVLLFEQPEADR